MLVQPFPPDAAMKREIALRYWLLGRGYHRALRAMDINQRLFPGFRKDGVTPAFDHHICQAQYMRTLLTHVRHPEETLATIFFHDSMEDCDLSPEDIRACYKDDLAFGEMVAQSTVRVTKKWRGRQMDTPALFCDMGECPVSSLVKGGDRIHNFQTMVGVFSDDKQRAYLQEGVDWFLPMLKEAERRFPDQEPAYKNIRSALKTQIALISMMLNQKAESAPGEQA